MSQFIESIKIEDQKAYLLDLHQKRVDETFSHFGAEGTLDLQEIFNQLAHDDNGLYKLRIVYDLKKNYKTRLIPYAISEMDLFQLIENNTCDYAFKFAERSDFETMKTKVRAQEIIVVKNNHITDTSYSNLLFLKNKIWYTPTTYLLNGVQRQNLLRAGKIKEAEITLENISTFSHFQLINALNEFDESLVYPIERIVNLPKNKKNTGI